MSFENHIARCCYINPAVRKHLGRLDGMLVWVCHCFFSDAVLISTFKSGDSQGLGRKLASRPDSANMAWRGTGGSLLPSLLASSTLYILCYSSLLSSHSLNPSVPGPVPDSTITQPVVCFQLLPNMLSRFMLARFNSIWLIEPQCDKRGYSAFFPVTTAAPLGLPDLMLQCICLCGADDGG
jgi:hypothetical protein